VKEGVDLKKESRRKEKIQERMFNFIGMNGSHQSVSTSQETGDIRTINESMDSGLDAEELVGKTRLQALIYEKERILLNYYKQKKIPLYR